MKKTLLTAALMLCAMASFGQKMPKRPEPKVEFNQKGIETQRSKESVQGTAVWGDLLFSMRNTGLCVVIDMKKKELVSEFKLASYGEMNHANDAFFGPDKYDENDKFPLIYISQCKDKPVKEIGLPETDSHSRLCFVERILTDETGKPVGTQIVQLIYLKLSKKHSRLMEFDPKNPQYLYTFGNTVGNEKPGNHIIFQRLPFPKFSKDKFFVELSEDDIQYSFYIDEVLPEGVKGPQENILQGGLVYDGLLYLPVGAGSKHPSHLYVIDLRYGEDHSIRKGCWYDYSDVITCEMEDMDVWRNKIVCTTNSHEAVRPVYSFKRKSFKIINFK